MRNILVTGGAGNIGGALALALSEDSQTSVTVVDSLETSTREKIPQHEVNPIRFIKADVNQLDDITAIMSSQRYDYVFHYAALVGVKRTLLRPVDVLRDINGISNILSLAKNTGVKRIFYSSSSEVYGEPVEFPQNEKTTPLNSRLPYAIVKNVGEAFFRSFNQEFGLDYTIFRFFNTYGPRQSADFVISKFLQSALKDQAITVYGDGLQSRTFCYIDDNVSCAINCLDDGLAVNEVVNVGSDHETSILELANLCIALTQSQSQIVHLPPLADGDMTRRQPDIGRMKNILGRDLLPLRDGLSKVLEHYNSVFANEKL